MAVKITDLERCLTYSRRICPSCGGEAKFRYKANVEYLMNPGMELAARECTICGAQSYEVWQNGKYNGLLVHRKGKGED